MKTAQIIFVSFLMFSGKNLYSQNFEVPRNYHFKVAGDYAPYEKDIVEAAKWLIATPFNEQTEKRKEVSAFVVQWINGSPTVNVEVTPIIMDFENANEGMLVLFMAASAKYVLEHNFSKDMRAKHKAALHDMITVYKKGAGMKKDKKMEKLVKSEADGKMDKWLDENMKVTY